ncbi:MAG: fused MFS/spermidine synthase [Betaproteobacteria bacterium]
MTQVARPFYLLLTAFVASGFSGLFYESVWAQYLKLFLGHAAYAQTMVLCIFMGGLALGAWLAARYTERIRHPLRVYALVEVIVGVLALVFHAVFTRVVEFHYQSLLPLTTDPVAATAVKGLLAMLLIGPQTVLLGATFPLMTAGVLRALSRSSGQSISLLYFSNSIGAAGGVLASAFVLIPRAGLPGTMLAAGLISILVGLAVWLIARNEEMRGSASTAKASEPQPVFPGTAPSWTPLAPWVLLLVAAFTGMASFVYEVVWIRMLSLVLGASTHSFELMLSAFITGLALGSWAIRRHIDRIAEPYRVLGYIQVVMGLFALGSLWVYSESFHWMATVMNAVARTEQGYALFLLASHAICFAVMLPATFMAGMTLPLITNGLLRDGYGERALGAVYASNTVGSIGGVAFAQHIAIPLTGLKTSLIIGGGLDIAIGIILLFMLRTTTGTLRPALVSGLAFAGIVAAVFRVTLDPLQLNSGVYRYARATLAGDTQILFYEDGKTASISLYWDKGGDRTLATNGKPDGRISAFKDAPSGDDVTTTLLGALGMAFHPDARSAANIGLGTGLTSRVLLRNPRLQYVHSIEIEQKVVDAVQHLRDEVEVVFSDPRSRIIVDDAKTFFAARRARYDIVVAEPSNPWVSGVASLFTGEFYRRMLDHLNERGVFVQWLQGYEIDMESVSSVIRALGSAFGNYAVYSTNGVDLLVVAWKEKQMREPDGRVLDWPELKPEWRRVGVDTLQDLDARRIGGKVVLHPLFRSYPVPENSDYFPYLDDRAPRARFLRHSADGLNTIRTASLPLVEMLEGYEPRHRETRLAQTAFVHRAVATRDAMAAYRVLRGEKSPDGLLRDTKSDLAVMASYCDDKNLFDDKEAMTAFVGVAGSVVPYLTREESRLGFSALQTKCLARMGDVGTAVRELVKVVIERDAKAMRTEGEALLKKLPQDADRRLWQFALNAAMLGSVVDGAYAHADALWQQYGRRVQKGDAIPIENRLLLAVAAVRMKEGTPSASRTSP